MATSNAPILAVLAVACLLIAMPSSVSALSCGQVSSSLSQCIPYIRGTAALSPGCCSGIKNLNSMAQSTVDRQTACNCLKGLAQKITALKPDLAAGLPGKCGVSVPYPISTSTDCTKVH